MSRSRFTSFEVHNNWFHHLLSPVAQFALAACLEELVLQEKLPSWRIGYLIDPGWERIAMSGIDEGLSSGPRIHVWENTPAKEDVSSHDFKDSAFEHSIHSYSHAFHLSVVIPAHNEAANLPSLVQGVWDACQQLFSVDITTKGPLLRAFEIIVVNDGSTDSTSTILKQLEACYPGLRTITLPKNMGQSIAILAGLRGAQGDMVGTLDADLQNDPADLVALWKALPGYDVALGWRVNRADTFGKRIVSRLANWTRNRLLRQSIQDTGCSLRLFPRAVALRLPFFQGMHRFWGPLFLREGCRLIQVPVRHYPRTSGRSHYTLWNRSIMVMFDLLGVMWLMRRPVQYQGSSDPTWRLRTNPHAADHAKVWKNHREVA